MTITWPVQCELVPERALCEAFGLREALVLRPSGGDQTYEVIHAVRPCFQGHVDVAQAVGSMAVTMPELDSAALTRKLQPHAIIRFNLACMVRTLTCEQV